MIITQVMPQYILHLVSHPTIDTRLEGLFEILQRYREERDDLSLAISNWGMNFSLLIGTGSDDLAERIDELRRRVLVNRIDGAPLRSPVVANGEVWEEEMLAHLRSIRPINPFDLEPLEEERPHLFAREMLGWVDACLQETKDEELQEIIDEVRRLETTWNLNQYINLNQARESNPIEAAMNYVYLAQMQLRISREMRWQGVFLSVDEKLDELVTTLSEEIAASLASVRETLRSSEADLETRLDALQEINQRIREALEEQIARAREDLARIRQTVARQEETISHLSNRVNEQSREIADLRNQNEQNRQAAQRSGGGGCVVS